MNSTPPPEIPEKLPVSLRETLHTGTSTRSHTLAPFPPASPTTVEAIDQPADQISTPAPRVP
ncbi:hypothetical protein [Oleiharenicola lentus]|uniref:hypothetical protein n=1 Tax=Oleiharenicola lentus TaxID=2508720 RepID=UPI003F66DD3F